MMYQLGFSSLCDCMFDASNVVGLDIKTRDMQSIPKIFLKCFERHIISMNFLLRLMEAYDTYSLRVGGILDL
jgi:hypothetical protein